MIIVFCLGLAVAWYVWIATKDEAERFAPRLGLAFLYLGIGFVVFETGYPEKRFR